MSVGCFVVLRVRKRQRNPDLVVKERYTNDYVQISPFSFRPSIDSPP